MFDDGNEKYENYDNRWKRYGYWKEKWALINVQNKEIRVGSISSWKVNLTT